MKRRSDKMVIPLRIASIYAVTAALWILFSDELLAHMFADSATVLRLSIVKGFFFVLITATLLWWLIRRNVSAMMHRDQKLREDIQGILAATGEDFFAPLVKHLARTLQADYTLIGDFDPETLTVRTIAVFGKGSPQDNFEYTVDGIPCATALAKGKGCSHTHGLDLHVPKDHVLAQLGITSCICSPLLDSTGKTLGMMAALGCRPLETRGVADSLFQLFAVRAAAELERRRAEKALQGQFDELTTLFDSVNAVICAADLITDEILYLNRFGSGLFGEEWQGRTWYDFLHPGQEEIPSFCPSQKLIAGGKPQAPCFWEFQETKTGRWFQCIDRAIRWTDGRLVRMEIAFDISERKEVERMKDELISAVSHEMRTPLTAMLGFTEFMLDNDVPPAEQKEYLRTVYHETERLNDLIGNFLDLQRLKMRPEPFDVRHLSVEMLLKDISALYGATPQKHRLTVDCPSGLPPIVGNEGQLHQVLMNLVSNAIKYSPEGSAIMLGAGREGEYVVIWVRDEGIGIPAELQDKIFEKFYRVDNNDRRMVGGTGLGLALVREIVAAHGGRVWVESSTGRGSTFFIQLSAAPA